MIQSPDSQVHYLDQLLSRLRVTASQFPPATSTNYMKAITAFESFSATYPHDIVSVSREILADWTVSMALSGHSRKTILHYINSLSAILPKEELEDAEAFASVKSRLRKLSPEIPDSLIAPHDFARLLQLIKIMTRLPEKDHLAVAILTIGLLNPGRTISEIARLEKENLELLNPASREIAARFISPRRKYVFPLNQSQTTPRQLDTLIGESIIALLRSRNIAVTGSAETTLQSYWAYAALTAGATPCEILTILDRIPAGMPVFSVCPRLEYRPIAPDVDTLLLSNPLQWHAMRLRPGVKFATLTARLSALSDAGPDLFYPSVEIARRIGKKLVYCNRPLIADIVFFRSRITDITPLFRHIGDIAWCYRNSSSDSLAYATIPDSAMLEFQTAIGIFTSDMDLYPIGTIELQPDDIVEVVGDIFAGHHARVEGHTPGHATVYRLIIWGDNGLEWRADIDGRLIKKLSSAPQLTVA